MPATAHCRLCGSAALTPYLNLGFTPHSDHFPTEKQLRDAETHYPLIVVLCRTCGVSQLSYTVDPRVLYQKDYLYESSITKTGTAHYHEFARSVVKRFALTKRDLVVDIGSNVGILLEGFQQAGTRILGIDPATNIARIANRRGIRTIADFFVPRTARAAKRKFGSAKIIVGTNVFAHIFDHKQFIDAVKLLLSKDGVFIFESPHLSNLIENLEYDTIYHQHLLYLSLQPVIRFFKKYGMEVFDTETFSIHGGSFRVFVGYPGKHPVTRAVSALLARERKAGIHSLATLRRFAQRVEAHRRDLMKLLARLKQNGKTIAVVSTPAKGMTLLNYCRIGPEHIDFATEKSLLKVDRFTPGTHIPIFPDSELLRRQPDYALLLAWNFAEEIIKNLETYRRRGGKFIVPIPKLKIRS